jgi:hypothetical protein
VNDFVEECRLEWKRLGVPDPVANEMAADLAADLEEAEADGVSAEEVLGSGAFDPRSFATAWAAERGVIQRPLPSGHPLPRGSRMLAAIGAFALIAITGAVLVILASASVSRRLTLASPVRPPLGAVWVRPDPQPGPGVRAVTVRAVSPDGRLLAIESASGRLTINPLVSAVDINDSGADTRTVGTVLLIVGLAGVVPLTMFWLWVGPDRRSRRRTHIDDRPSGPVY